MGSGLMLIGFIRLHCGRFGRFGRFVALNWRVKYLNLISN